MQGLEFTGGCEIGDRVMAHDARGYDYCRSGRPQMCNNGLAAIFGSGAFSIVGLADCAYIIAERRHPVDNRVTQQ